MAAHANLPTVMNKKSRTKAVGSAQDFADDAMATYLTKHAEQIFEPKRVLSSNDWLARYREPDQFFESYRQGHGSIKWMTPQHNKVFIFAPDDSFDGQQLAAFQRYASAFFRGVIAVETIKAGDQIPG